MAKFSQNYFKTKPPIRTKLAQVVKGFNKGFLLLLIYELIEEAIEELIAWSISVAIAKAISFLLVVFLTQSTKVGAKALVVVLKPAIKKLTYKRGNDKMDKIKSFVTKAIADLKANWKNYLGVISVIATAILPFFQDAMDFGIGIQVGGFNIIPFVVIILTGIIGIIGVCVDGTHKTAVWAKIVELKNNIKAESAAQKAAIADEKAREAEEKRLYDEAQEELAREEYERTNAELIKQQAAEAERKAKEAAEAAEKAEAERRERINAYKAKILAEKEPASVEVPSEPIAEAVIIEAPPDVPAIQ